jgi:hypothetical protein
MIDHAGLYCNKMDRIHITIYVDDLKIVDADDAFISNVKRLPFERFKMKDLGPAIYYLGIDIVRIDTTITLR